VPFFSGVFTSQYCRSINARQ